MKNDPLFSLEDHEPKAFIGFLIYSGYVTLPSEPLYWSDADDVAQNTVKQLSSIQEQVLEDKSVPTCTRQQQSPTRLHRQGFQSPAPD